MTYQLHIGHKPQELSKVLQKTVVLFKAVEVVNEWYLRLLVWRKLDL